jgi:hypothetical protein
VLCHVVLRCCSLYKHCCVPRRVWYRVVWVCSCPLLFLLSPSGVPIRASPSRLWVSSFVVTSLRRSCAVVGRRSWDFGRRHTCCCCSCLTRRHLFSTLDSFDMSPSNHEDKTEERKEVSVRKAPLAVNVDDTPCLVCTGISQVPALISNDSWSGAILDR